MGYEAMSRLLGELTRIRQMMAREELRNLVLRVGCVETSAYTIYTVPLGNTRVLMRQDGTEHVFATLDAAVRHIEQEVGI